MNIKKKGFTFYFLFIFLLLFILFLYFFINQNNKEKNKILPLKPISINLLTSVHPNLSWNFMPASPKVNVNPGEVTTIDYMVENFGDKESTGIATFVYFPKQFENYISKINCFCYDAQTLKPQEKNKFTLVLLIDPEVTKDSKTKNVKEITIQFIFFDYKEYKKSES